MNRPLVSVITGTYNRHEEVLGAIENVRAQTYPNIEHIIVSDGPDPELRKELSDYDWLGNRALRMDEWLDPIAATSYRRHVPTKFVETGRQWSQFLAASISTVPFQVAQWLARGDYLCWLADDERMTPDHIESLVSLLEETDSDFVYPRVELTYAPHLGAGSSVIGVYPPAQGQITHALFRAELLDYRGFTTHVGSATDWDQISHWIAAGARCAMLDRVTLTHRMDKFGEGPEYREMRQPLRGHYERVIA